MPAYCGALILVINLLIVFKLLPEKFKVSLLPFIAIGIVKRKLIGLIHPERPRKTQNQLFIFRHLDYLSLVPQEWSPRASSTIPHPLSSHTADTKSQPFWTLPYRNYTKSTYWQAWIWCDCRLGSHGPRSTGRILWFCRYRASPKCCTVVIIKVRFSCPAGWLHRGCRIRSCCWTTLGSR